MPIANYSTGPVSATSATTNIRLLAGMATSLLGSTSIPGSSGTTLTGFFTNLINSSGVLNATSAAAVSAIGNSVVSYFNVILSSSAALESNQMLMASSAMSTMLIQSQNGYLISS